MRGRIKINVCARCNHKAARMAIINAMGSGKDMFFVKCTNPSCKRRTYATDTISGAIKDWNAGRVFEKVESSL